MELLLWDGQNLMQRIQWGTGLIAPSFSSEGWSWLGQQEWRPCGDGCGTGRPRACGDKAWPPMLPMLGQPWSARHLSTSSNSAHRGHSHLRTEELLAELEGHRMALNKQTQYMLYSLLSPVFGEGCCLLPRPRIITDMHSCSESFHAY